MRISTSIEHFREARHIRANQSNQRFQRSILFSVLSEILSKYKVHKEIFSQPISINTTFFNCIALVLKIYLHFKIFRVYISKGSLLFNFFRLKTFLIALFFFNSSYSQIIFRELPNNLSGVRSEKNTYNNSNSEIISLNGKWELFPADKPENKFSINIPSVFEGAESFVYKKKFKLSENHIKNFKIELVFLGVNYSADIRLNNALIYRHTGGDIPFIVSLPRDILFSDKENVLQVNLDYDLTAETTIPLNKRFLFPKNFGGIFRDVFLKISPAVNIQSLDVNSVIDFNTNRAKIDLTTFIENREAILTSDTVLSNQDLFTLNIQIIAPDGKTVSASERKDFQLKRNKETTIKSTLLINSPSLWSPNFPISYTIQAEILRNGSVINQFTNSLALFEIKSKDDNLTLNNKPFVFQGVTYVPTYFNYGALISLEQIENDIKKIKNSGFNSIRFLKSIPHPHILKLCEIYGLFPIVDLPLSDIPEGLANSQNFRVRVKNYLQLLLKAYNEYSLFTILNLGSSYLGNSQVHSSFLSELSNYVKEKKNLMITSSFFGIDVNKIDGIDLYGIELINESVLNQAQSIQDLQTKLGRGKVYLSEATYTISAGQSDGYVNNFSFEAQAKFFEDLIKYTETNRALGYFINSIYDYRGDFASLFFRFDKENVYKIGLISEDRNEERLAYKVVTSYLQDTERVTIPIGSNKDDSPMIFIITGLFLALFMGVLVNSGKKFREDATRALLRSYNFFADIRDQRIISGYQSIFLLLIVSLTGSLIASNLLYYFRSDLFIEKLLLSFGSKNLMLAFVYLAWNPLNSILWLFVISLAVLFALMLIIRAFAFFVRNRVYISSVFFVIVWSLLPLVLFIPLGIILYRVLVVDLINSYLYIFLILLKLWLTLRLIKGIYVIYDVNPGPVYFYSFLFIVLTISVFLMFFEFNNSLIDNITLVLKQFEVF